MARTVLFAQIYSVLLIFGGSAENKSTLLKDFKATWASGETTRIDCEHTFVV